MNHAALSAAAGGMLLVAFASAYGQEAPVGRYSGETVVTSPFPGAKTPRIKVDLVFTGVENGVVKGEGTSHSKACAGKPVPIAGKLEGNKLAIQAADGRGPDADCAMIFDLTIVDGKTLQGTSRSGFAVKLTKQ